VLSLIIHFASDSQKGFFSDGSNISWHLERAFFNGTKKKNETLLALIAAANHGGFHFAIAVA
jgi:hypothetical protein